MKCILVWQICKNMVPQCLAARRWVWLGWLRPWLLAGYGHHSAVAPTMAEAMGWFSPSTGRRSGRYVHPVGVVPVPTPSDHRLLTRDILGYPRLISWLIPGYTSLAFLSQLQVSRDMQVSTSYPDLSWVIPIYVWSSAQGVAFPDAGWA